MAKKLKRAAQRPVTMKRYIELMKRHLNDTGMTYLSIAPPATPEEEAAAKFAASEIVKQLRKPADDTSGADQAAFRHTALTVLRMYQMSTHGIVEWCERQLMLSKLKKGADEQAPDASLTAER